MFAYTMNVRLKKFRAIELSRLVESQILPEMQGQPGFIDAMNMVSGENASAQIVTYWADRRSIAKFEDTVQEKLLQKIEPLLAEPARMATSVVASSTWHRIAPRC